MTPLHVTYRMAFDALMSNKSRSTLTCLGICVGIAAVIAVLAIGRGASALIEKEVASSGKNLLRVTPEWKRKGRVSVGTGGGQNMTLADVAAIERELDHLVYAATPSVGTTRQVIYRNKNWYTNISCDTEKYPEMHNWTLAEGRFFDASELKDSRRVCVLGKTVRDKIFEPYEDPIGTTIRIGSMPFKVVGIFGEKGVNAWGGDQDNWVTMPYTTFEKFIFRSRTRSISGLTVSLYSPQMTEEATREVTALLRQRHRLQDWQDDDFTVVDEKEMLAIRTAVSSRMTLLLSIIAFISLLVGGVGVMNIMLVTVSERIREIGLRLAIGATPNSILRQFIFEAASISAFGGVLGVLAGISLSHAIGWLRGWPILVEPTTTAAIFLFSVLIGLFFGFYPAYRASKLTPMICLRSE